MQVIVYKGGEIIMESKFYKWSKNGMKMIINSDFKEFNNQTNYISSGNIIANTMYGCYIRPYNEIECNGIKFEKGHLFNYDLQYFNISYDLKEYIKSLNKQVVLYEIFIHRNGKKDIIGWLIENEGKTIDIFVNNTLGNYNKRFSALDTVRNIIEEKNN